MAFHIVILLTILVTPAAFSQTATELNPVYSHFSRGYYADSLDEIDKLKKKYPKSGLLHYWEGLCYKKMQEYQDAHELFVDAKKLGYNNKELNYEHGQVLYALKKNKHALAAFTRSIRQNFQVAQSKIYIAQILEELKYIKKAYKFYDSASKSNDENISQAATFKKAEILKKRANLLKNPKDILVKKVLPKYQQALDKAPNSSIAQQISYEIYKLKNAYGLLPRKLKNGNFLPIQKWDFDFTQTFGYESNVVQEADGATVSSSQKDSAVLTSDLFAAYRFNIEDTWIIEPKFRTTKARYSERENADVYQNDNWATNFKLKTRYEHFLFGKKATASFEPGWTYNQKDFNSRKELSDYNDTYLFTLSEKFNVFTFGPTTLRLKFEVVEDAAPTRTLDRETTGFNLEQTINFPNSTFLLLVNENRYNRYKVAKTTNTNSSLIRADYIVPDLFLGFDATVNFSFTATDYFKQKDARGVETKRAPGFNIARTFWKKLKLKLKYTSTRNSSKDKNNYEYENNVSEFELKYSF